MYSPTIPWHYGEIKCQVQATAWSTSGATQVSGGRQSLVAFGKGMPYQSLSETQTTLIWYLNHYQGYGRQCIWSQYSPIPWPTPSVQCGPPSAILSTITRHIRHCITAHTHRVKSRLHGKSFNWSNHGHIHQAHSPSEHPTVSSCQSKPTPSPGQVAHQGPSLAEISSSHGGTQRNGDH